MNVIIILLGVGVFVSALFLGAFIWCIRSSQFEDDFSPSVRILFDDKIKSEDNSKTAKPVTINNITETNRDADRKVLLRQ